MRIFLAVFVIGCASGQAAEDSGGTGGYAGVGGTPDASGSGGNPGTGGASGSGGVGGAGGIGGAGGTGGAGGIGAACTDPTSTVGDNCSAPLSKCALTFANAATMATIACTTGGPAQTGQACDRPTDTPGVDTCVAGDFCSALDVASGRVCRRVCNSAQLCAGTEGCFELQLPYGSCRPAVCSPFGAASPCPQGNALAPNQVCSWGLLLGRTASAPVCTLGGTSAVGGACNAIANPPILCAQGAICLSDNLCHPTCDNAHPCPPGLICQSALYADASGGTFSAPGPNGGGWCD
jgi:hypothetical protein